MDDCVIIHGNCLDKLRDLGDCSVDSVVVDPPYGLSEEPDIFEVLTHWLAGDDYTHRAKGGFMGKAWDSFVPGPAIWKEVRRVLKPGGHALVFAGSGTTGAAARTEGIRSILIELEVEHVGDIRFRMGDSAAAERNEKNALNMGANQDKISSTLPLFERL